MSRTKYSPIMPSQPISKFVSHRANSHAFHHSKAYFNFVRHSRLRRPIAVSVKKLLYLLRCHAALVSLRDFKSGQLPQLEPIFREPRRTTVRRR